jgi:hypothetical protein
VRRPRRLYSYRSKDLQELRITCGEETSPNAAGQSYVKRNCIRRTGVPDSISQETKSVTLLDAVPFRCASVQYVLNLIVSSRCL